MHTTRILATTAALAVLLTAAGCGDDPTTAAAPGKKKTIELITGVKSDPFYITMTCAAQAHADKLGVTFKANGSAQWDVAVQRPLIDAVGATRPDALLISPVDSAALTPSLQQVQRAGTKVVLVDTSVSDPTIGVSRISSDNEAGGVVAAKALATLMGEKGSAIVMSVKPGITTTDARIKGFTDEIRANHPGITVLPVLYNNDLPATAASQIQATLSAHPDLGGVFAGNIITGQGVATGLQASGKQGAVKVAAFDAGPEQVQALQNGTVQVLIAQDPAGIGVQGVDQAVAALDGKTVTARIGTPMVAVTKENLGDPNVSKYLYKASC